MHAQAASHKLHVMLYSSPFVSRLLHVALPKLHAMLCILWPTLKDHCVGETDLVNYDAEGQNYYLLHYTSIV